MTTSNRPSLDRLHIPSWMRKIGWWVIAGLATCAGTWLWGYSQSAARSVVTEPRLQGALVALAICDEDEAKLIAKQDRPPSIACQLKIVRGQLLEASRLLAEQSDRITTLDRERFQSAVRVSNLQRDLIGVQVALDRALQHVADAKMRDAIYESATGAKDTWDNFVLQEPRDQGADPMTDATNRVLRQARVPR